MAPVPTEIHVVFSADNVVAMPLAVAIASVVRTAARPEALRFHVLDGGLSPRSRRRIDAMAAQRGHAVSWLPVASGDADRLSRLYTRSTRDYPPSAYARLLIGDLLPPTASKAIYLDADVIARVDIARLWASPMEGALALAVADMPFDNGCLARIRRTVDPARHPVPADLVYFQSGVMVFDLDGFRAGRIGEKAFECLRAYPTLTFPDQDALNIVLAGRSRLIDPRWNQMTAVFGYDTPEGTPFDAATLAALREDPFIVHFSGRPKPWEQGCAHPFLDEWIALQAETPWAGWRPTPLNRAIAWLPRGRRLAVKRLRRRLGLAPQG
jgi:lipopolysaccharide biosynthesis glycosyltransferase